LKIYYTDRFVLPLPEGHRFPMSKYALLRERVEGAAWSSPSRMLVPHAATDEELRRAHATDYLWRVDHGHLTRREVRRIGFPWSPEMVQRSRRSAGATIEACRAALDDGIAVSLAGGTHHAFHDQGEGFCVFNDSVVAARTLRNEGLVDRVVVIDCDVHQGNGTAALCADDPGIFTFSIHGAKNFPFHKETSDLDIALDDGTGDRDYLDALEQGLDRALGAAQAGLAIYLAGADPWSGDRWGRLSLSKEGLAERDRVVLERCRHANLPVAITMAGGYAPVVEDTVEIHFRTVELAATRGRAWS
jgi:acetoin utilization deacetylase AcuC-like enzyme